MLFNNPEIIRTSADSRIGGVDLDVPKVDFNNYMYAVKCRIVMLICKFVDDQVSGGMSIEDARKEALGTVYNYLHINVTDKTFDDSEMGLAEQIMVSDEFKDWRVKIYYRFQDQHNINVGGRTPIEVNFNLNEDLEEIMEEEENMFTILEGLVAQYK